MHLITIPQYEPKTKTENGRSTIYDLIRRKYVALTPEELVRQSFLFYLMEELDYPKGMIMVEKEVKVGSKSNRSDIQVLLRDGSCFMLVECKSFKTPINQQVFDQAAKYASQLKAQYLVTTNGINTYCCKVDHQSRQSTFLDAIPPYERLS